MILEVFPDTRKLDLDLGAGRFEDRSRADTAPLQNLRRVGSSGGDDDLASGADFPSGFGHFAVSRRVSHPFGGPGVRVRSQRCGEHDLRDSVTGQEMEVVAAGGAILLVVVTRASEGPPFGGRVARVGGPDDAGLVARGALLGEPEAGDSLEGVPHGHLEDLPS